MDGIVGEATYRALKEASYRLGARTLYHQFGAPLYGDDVATLQAGCRISVSTPAWSTATSGCRPTTL
ncbi:putative n-acetymuramyl-L-alanine amidase [Mycobacterium avium subsp. avium 2285 (R)]|nr:putative n-acetymuramyl-L-alanine amidase [Mycobacterium avium subsp. avium 2285 (R)]